MCDWVIDDSIHIRGSDYMGQFWTAYFSELGSNNLHLYIKFEEKIRQSLALPVHFLDFIYVASFRN